MLSLPPLPFHTLHVTLYLCFSVAVFVFLPILISVFLHSRFPAYLLLPASYPFHPRRKEPFFLFLSTLYCIHLTQPSFRLHASLSFFPVLFLAHLFVTFLAELSDAFEIKSSFLYRRIKVITARLVADHTQVRIVVVLEVVSYICYFVFVLFQLHLSFPASTSFQLVFILFSATALPITFIHTLHAQNITWRSQQIYPLPWYNKFICPH